MEDAATAEICRAQVWQWIRQEATLEDDRVASPALFERLLAEEMAALEQALPTQAFVSGRFADAIRLFRDMSLASRFEEFLTLPAYEVLEGGR
jgi:malate synthase